MTKINTPESRMKYKAMLALNKAIRAGKVLPAKKQKCAHCGSRAQDLHHHQGYDKEHQLDVIPLCKLCHRQEHMRIQKPSRIRQKPLRIKEHGYCPVCDGPLPEWAQSNRVYCSTRCRNRVPTLRRAHGAG